MKNKLIHLFVFAALFFMMGCSEDLVFYEGPSRAQFGDNGSGTLIINPAQDTRNVFTVGVTATSNVDRTFRISVSEESTLDLSYYSIEIGDVGVIPAGSFVGEIPITTFATTNFPPTGSQLILELEEVEDTEFIQDAKTTLTLGFLVACELDVSASVGTYQITRDDFGTSVNNGTFEVIAGAEPNQLIMVNPFGHTNPATGAQDYQVVITINPTTGAATITRQDAWHCDNFGCGFGQGRVESVAGTGFVFSCLESMQFTLRHTVNAGSFGNYAFAAEKI